MNILALDLGTKCGYAVESLFLPLISGTWDTAPTRFESAGQRFIKFTNRLDHAIKEYHIDLVVFEEVRNHFGVDAAHMYGGYLSILQLICLGAKIEYKGIPVGTIKKHAGKGNFKKADMIIAANRFYPGVNVTDDNHADALCLLHYITHQ